MNDLLREIFETKKVISADGQALPLHSHIPPFEGEVLQTWIAERQPRRLLEIGFAYGISALFVCEAIESFEPVSHDIIDPSERTDWQSVGTLNLERAGYAGRYTWHEQPSEICLPHMLAQGKQIDFALIDGFHTFDHTLVDFFYVNRMLAVGGIVIIDDIELPAIRKVAAFVNTYECYEPLALPESLLNSVIARARSMLNLPPSRLVGFTKVAMDKRGWDWYRDF